MNKTILLIIAMSLFLVTTASAALTDGLVSYWTFDDANLSQGNNTDVHGRNNASKTIATTGESGILGESFFFDGVNDEVEVARNESLEPRVALSISAWVKPNQSGSEQAIVWKYGLDFKGYNLDIATDNDGRFAASKANPNERNIADSGQDIGLNDWTHFVGMVTILFSLDKVPGDLPSSTLVGGLVFGLGAILFPKHIHNYDRWIRGRDEKTPDKRTLHKIRLFGIGIIILAILIEIYL